MFVMQLEGGMPVYEQLCERITELISAGTLAEGEKLPAVREVAKSLGINPNTVQKAYAALEQRGLIYSVPAKGSYVGKAEATVSIIRERAKAELREQLVRAMKSGVSEGEILELVKEIKEGESK